MIKHTIAAIGLVGFLAGSNPAGAEPAAPAATPAPSPMPEVLPRTRMALKLAGLVTFVANSCPGLKPDYVRFRNALGGLGLATQNLAKADLKAEYLGYAAKYQVDATASCERARLQFGPQGTTISGLFVANAALPPQAPK